MLFFNITRAIITCAWTSMSTSIQPRIYINLKEFLWKNKEINSHSSQLKTDGVSTVFLFRSCSKWIETIQAHHTSIFLWFFCFVVDDCVPFLYQHLLMSYLREGLCDLETIVISVQKPRNFINMSAYKNCNFYENNYLFAWFKTYNCQLTGKQIWCNAKDSF